MKTKFLSIDATLLALWTVLLVYSLTGTTELHFGFPIQAHLSVLAVLIIARMIFKKFILVKSNAN